MMDLFNYKKGYEKDEVKQQQRRTGLVAVV